MNLARAWSKHGVSERSLDQLLPVEDKEDIDKWVIDEAIDGYLRIYKDGNDSAWKDVLLLNSKFFDKFVGVGYDGVSKWSKGEKKRVVTPVNVGKNHWIALAVDFDEKIVLSMDSLRMNNGESVDRTWHREKMLEWVKEEWDRGGWEEEFDEKAWKSEEAVVPKQRNSYDCGVFASMNIHGWVDPRQPKFFQRNMSQMRGAMIFRILTTK